MAKVRLYMALPPAGLSGKRRTSASCWSTASDAVVQRAALLARRAGGLWFPLLRYTPRSQTRRCGGAAGRLGQARVALGVVVTALTQAVLGGIGLAISGVPYAALLTVVMIFTCLVQLGLCWFWCRRLSGFTGAGTPPGAPCCCVELRGWHHGQRHSSGAYPCGRRPADDPHPTGVIGGLIAFGMIGLFIGPVLLAVSGVCMTPGYTKCRRRRKTLMSSSKSLASWRLGAVMPGRRGDPPVSCPPIVKLKFIDRRQSAGPERHSLAFLPGPSQQL